MKKAILLIAVLFGVSSRSVFAAGYLFVDGSFFAASRLPGSVTIADRYRDGLLDRTFHQADAAIASGGVRVIGDHADRYGRVVAYDPTVGAPDPAAAGEQPPLDESQAPDAIAHRAIDGLPGLAAGADGLAYVSLTIPEPAVWLLMTIGFGTVGGMMRWRSTRRDAAIGDAARA